MKCQQSDTGKDWLLSVEVLFRRRRRFTREEELYAAVMGEFVKMCLRWLAYRPPMYRADYVEADEQLEGVCA